MKPFLPPKTAPIVFGLLVSGMMTFIVSGIATFNAIGLNEALVSKWATAWITSWIVAFPIILFVAPTVNWLVQRITKQPDKT